jgi:hypothetical protein
MPVKSTRSSGCTILRHPRAIKYQNKENAR